MRLFLLNMAFGFLTLAMMFHGFAAESALAPTEIPHGDGWKADGTVDRTKAEPKAATKSHPPSNSVYKNYRFGMHKHDSFAHFKTAATHCLSPSSSPVQSPSPLKEPTAHAPYTFPIISPCPLLVGSSLHDSLHCPVICNDCNDPLTPAPCGSPCGCVLPIKVRLSLNVSLYTLAPLISVLEREIAASTYLKISQVRTIGADVAGQKQDQTIVEVDLLPIEKAFSQRMASLISMKFIRKQVLLDEKLFGAYDVLNVQCESCLLHLDPPQSPLSNNAAAVVKGPDN